MSHECYGHSSSLYKSYTSSNGDIVQWLTVLVVLKMNQSSLPRTHILQLPALYNSIALGTLTPYSGVLWQPHVHINANRHIHMKNKIEPYKAIFLEFLNY